MAPGSTAAFVFWRPASASRPAGRVAYDADARTCLTAMDLIDISRPLSPATAVWPGDQPVEWNWTARIEDGSSVNLGALSSSVHAGTHVDAPHHVREEGSRTEDLDLSVFIGPAEVVAVDTDFVLPRHVEDVDAPRVLFKTAASAVPTGSWQIGRAHV